MNWERNSYDTIFLIVNWLTKIVPYKPVKIIIDGACLAKIIINIVVRHHDFPKSIARDQSSLLHLKFWFLLYYFLNIKQKPFTAFYLQTNN